MRIALPFALLAAFGASAQNATVDELFNEGVFGVKWTDNLQAVEARYPDGRRVRAGETELWRVRDDRTIFEIERRSLDTIEFGFFDGKLAGVNVSFRGSAGGVYEALTKFLGTASEQSVGESVASALGTVQDYVVLGTWDGTEHRARLTAIGALYTLTIEPIRTAAMPATRRQLGLE